MSLLRTSQTDYDGCSERNGSKGVNPWFTAVALLTLALGIGANTAIFNVESKNWLAHSVPSNPTTPD